MSAFEGSDGRILTGASFAIASAVLFGLRTPFAKILLGDVQPVLLARLLYAGSGVGLDAAPVPPL